MEHKMFLYDPNIHGLQIKSIGSKQVTDTAIASLRIALKSYFETYGVVRFIVNLGEIGDPKYNEDRVTESMEYQAKYIQTIFHFHHFIEIMTKDALRDIDPIYAIKINFDNLETLKKIQDRSEIEDSSHSIEYEAAIKRIMSLHTAEEVPVLTKIFYKKNVKKYCLDTLNQLRNRAWHRGKYILKYSELDQFMTRNLLPLVVDIVQSTNYDESGYWKYNKPATLQIDPIEELLKVGRGHALDYKRIGFLKAVGLACYNHKRSYGIERYTKRSLSEIKTEALVSQRMNNSYESRKCFVCNKNSLILFQDEDSKYDVDTKTYSRWQWNWKAECQECGLLLYDDVLNPKEYGIKDYDDIWISKIVNYENTELDL
ncbi:hypothetical protein [Paenibacillus sp. M2]|uniref:hypothetical protein n=1 Tax=Paenibacillus sp. M2 TaxID=3341793 RepID=UPI0039892216